MNLENNVRQAVPFFRVAGMERSLRFYVDGIGFKMTKKWMNEGKLRWCWLELEETALMLQEFQKKGHNAGAPSGKLGEGVSITYPCEDAIAIYHETLSREIQAKRPFVGNNMWVTSMTDPDGYVLEFESTTDAPEESVYPQNSRPDV